MNVVRDKMDKMGFKLPIPNINPNVVSGLSIISSMLFVLLIHVHLLLSFAFLVIAIVLDWFDGLTAKKHGKTSEEGYFVDITSDRLSEGIIFSPFFFPWFMLFALNCVLSVLSVVRWRHLILPLRHIFVVLYTAWMVFGQFGL